MKKNYLKHFQKLLQTQQIASTFTEKAINNQIDTLYIPFEGTHMGLTMAYVDSDAVEGQQGASLINFIQYHVALPLEIDSKKWTDVTEFISRMNLIVPIPGWILDKVGHAVHFRYVQVNPANQTLSDDLPNYMIQVIAFYLTRYVPLLIDLSSGKSDLASVLKKLQEP